MGKCILLETAFIICKLSMNEAATKLSKQWETEEEVCVHAISLLKLVHAFAELLDISGYICPEDGGKFLDKCSIFLDLPVYGVERRCVNFDQDFAGSRLIDGGVLNDKIAKSLVEIKCFLRGRHRFR